MLVLLRIIFGVGMLYAIQFAVDTSHETPLSHTNVQHVTIPMVILLFLGVANAIVWAPVVGNMIASPIAGSFTRSSFSWKRSRLYKHLLKLEARKKFNQVAWNAYFSGWFRSREPELFYMGMKNARPGGFLQKYFAYKVYGFLHGIRCLEAYFILSSLGENPPKHREQSINALIIAATKTRSKSNERVNVPCVPPAQELIRNEKISLPKQFDAEEVSLVVHRETQALEH